MRPRAVVELRHYSRGDSWVVVLKGRKSKILAHFPGNDECEPLAHAYVQGYNEALATFRERVKDIAFGRRVPAPPRSNLVSAIEQKAAAAGKKRGQERSS